MNGSVTAMLTEQSTGDDRDEPGSCPSSDVGEEDQPPERPGTTGTSAKVAVAVSARIDGLDPDWIHDCIERLLPLLGAQVARLAVEIVDDARMSDLHERYCSIKGTTDVLTFPAHAPGESIDVDIAVCADEAARRADEHTTDVNRELLLYVVHGLLHCCDFDDHDEADADAMHAEEDRLLEAIGVGRVFDRKWSGHDDRLATDSRDTGRDG